jgi:hypothetical protein
VGSGCGCISLAVLIFSAVISDYPYFWVYGWVSGWARVWRIFSVKI